jgi:hypothetical protein
LTYIPRYKFDEVINLLYLEVPGRGNRRGNVKEARRKTGKGLNNGPPMASMGL